MNRRLLAQVTLPAVIIGALLLAAGIINAWYISRLQRNLANILSVNVASLEAAQELEICVRQLRFHTFVYLIDPRPERLEPIEKDHERFDAALARAQQSAITSEEKTCIQAIKSGYRQYHHELTTLRKTVINDSPRSNIIEIADTHPIRHVVEPCQELFAVSKRAMDSTAEESNHVSQQARLAMLLLGIAAPLGGLVIGYGVARGLSRSIYQLSVRVQNMALRLDQKAEDVASVSIAADGDIRNLDNQIGHVVRRVEEVAERLQRQQSEMLRAEQLSAVGQLAAGIAHEVRNPLTAVKMLVEAALRPQRRKQLSEDDLNVIHGEVERLEQTVQSFLDFARLPTPQRSVCDIRDLVGGAVDLVKTRADQQRVHVTVRLSDAPVVVEVDSGQLRTVVVNLLLNALDAMPNGGTLSVILETTSESEVCLLVDDTGAGISPEFTKRLFKPFASTKPTGTGLGLSISRRIVEEHGGRIQGRNRHEGGARFSIQLPLAGRLSLVPPCPTSHVD